MLLLRLCMSSSVSHAPEMRLPYACHRDTARLQRRAICMLQRYAARLQRHADTGIAYNMQQKDLHLLGTAPPMPPPPLLRPFPSSLLFPAVAGGPTWPEGKACTHHSNGMATCSPANVVSQNRHEQASISRTPQNSMHACAPCTHSNAFTKTASHAGMQYKASSALGTGRLCHAKCSCRPGCDTSALDLRTQVRANARPPP